MHGVRAPETLSSDRQSAGTRSRLANKARRSQQAATLHRIYMWSCAWLLILHTLQAVSRGGEMRRGGRVECGESVGGGLANACIISELSSTWFMLHDTYCYNYHYYG